MKTSFQKRQKPLRNRSGLRAKSALILGFFYSLNAEAQPTDREAGGSAGVPCWAMLIEQHNEDGVQWVVSFEGSNPPADEAVWCANRDEAEKLLRLMNERPSCAPRTTEMKPCSK